MIEFILGMMTGIIAVFAAAYIFYKVVERKIKDYGD